MSFVQVDSSVRTNRKFLRAGPAASWLWLCGNAYCQETLTDGFIPFEAVRYLGVDNPKPLIPKLVAAELWDVVEGGWSVHDYLEHNRSAEEIRRLKRTRADGGKLGGRPPKEPSSETLEVSGKVNLPQNPYTDTPTDTPAETETSTSKRSALRASFEAFWSEYPRKVGKDAAWKEWQRVKPDASVVLSAVRQQRSSPQWTKDGGQFIPHPRTWLHQGRWKDEDSRPVAAPVPIWACPHREPCGNRAMCQQASILGRPERGEAAS